MFPTRFAQVLLGFALASISLLAQPPKPDGSPLPKPEELLEQAIAALKKRPWLEAELRQEVHSQGVVFRAQGRSIRAPGNRVRHELAVQVGDTKGTFKLLLDGKTFWRVDEAGSRKSVYTYGLDELAQAKKDLAAEESDAKRVELTLRDVDHEHHLAGIVPVLEDLKNRVRFTSVERETFERPGQSPVPVYVLSGEWTKEIRDQLAPPGKSDDPNSPDKLWESRRSFLFVPRVCRVYLARDTLWPYRIEWRGPVRPGGDNEMLTRLDLLPRDPPPEAEADRLFSPSEEERTAAKHLPPADLLKGRQARLAALRQQAEDAAKLRPLDPTLKMPGKP